MQLRTTATLVLLAATGDAFAPRAVAPLRRVSRQGLLDSLMGSPGFAAPCVMGQESLMSQKAHGTSEKPVQEDLRWACDGSTADRICNFNR
jgi:hypothetical protein